jgi:trehalose utilization protein
MWGVEVQSAVRQLQLYMWLMNEELARLGFPLWKRGYVEIFSQRTGKLMRRVPVYYDPDIENWIRHVVRCFQGLERVHIPYRGICRFCPRNIKEGCDWYVKPKRIYGQD